MPGFPDRTTSVWLQTVPPHTAYPALSEDLEVDVAIIGGGITGITLAYLLSDTGLRVALLEKSALAEGETGHTTAHIATTTDADYKDLLRDLGTDGARLMTRSLLEARAIIEAHIAAEKIDCDFRSVPGYLYAETAKDTEYLRSQLEHLREAGLEAVSWVDEVPLPFPTAGGLRYEDQAQFHVRKYLLPLAAAAAKRGVRIFEQTQVTDVNDGAPCTVTTADGTVKATHVVLASHVPLGDRSALWTKMSVYRSYVVAAKVDASKAVDGLFWDTEDPYHYTRTQDGPDGTWLIIGGEDHKVGDGGEESSLKKLTAYAERRFGVTPTLSWSGQINEPDDALPFIGESGLGDRIWMATGYSGTGMTFGTIAARILADRILGHESPYAKLYSPKRLHLRSRLKHLATEAVTAPKHLFQSKVLDRDVQAKRFSTVKPGEGLIVEVQGEKYAAAREKNGKLHVLSPVCPHMGCNVAWNGLEQTWDCPCHGSRYTPDGAILNGPTTKPLERKEVEEE